LIDRIETVALAGVFAIFWFIFSVILTWEMGKKMTSIIRNHLYTRFFSLSLSIVPVILRFNFTTFDTADFAVFMFINFYGQFFISQVIVFILNRRLKRINDIE